LSTGQPCIVNLGPADERQPFTNQFRPAPRSPARDAHELGSV